MKNTLALLLITFLMGTCLNAQVKIGDNPQNIDPSSVLELESTDKVLVITRVTTAQMNAISPIQGALCYNTELQAVHFYDGTQWVNIGSGGGTGGPLTADPIVNDVSTIVITPTATGDNLEVAPNSISSLQIIDGGINGIDIQDGSIGPGKLQNNSVTEEKLSENSVGAFALDNDNIGVSAFNNDVGYITAGDLDSSVSADANNAIVAGSDGGAYYDDTNLMNDVLDNATAIAADDDQSSANEIQNPSLTGTVIGLSGTAGTIDIGPLLTAGGSDNQNIGPLSLAGSVLTIGIEDGMAETIDLGALAGGTADGSETLVTAGTNVTVTGDGTTVTPYIINSTGGGVGDGSETIINTSPTVTVSGTGTTIDPYTLTSSGGADGSETVINTSPTVTVSGTGTTLDPYLLTSSGGADGSETILDATNSTITITGIGTTLDPYVLTSSAADVEFSPTGNTTSTNVQTAIVELQTDIDAISAGGEVNTASNQGTGGVSIVLPKDVADLPFKSINAGPSGILNVTDDTAENEIEIDIAAATAMPTPANQMLITNGTTNQVEWAPLASHTGAANSVFFADASTGAPTNSINPVGEPSFEWDPTARLNYGQLQIGLDGFTAPTDVSKVVIAETLAPGESIMYPLLVQTSAPALSNASTGILFSPETHAPGTLAKGALIYQRTGDWAIGDFHFLQTNLTGLAKPTTADKAFTVKNNKDIVLYGGIDINGIGLGDAGDVLTSTATGVNWAAPVAGAVSTDATIDGDGNTTDLTIAPNAITSARILDGEVQTLDIADNNVTPAKIAEGGNGEVLTTDASGDVVWAAPVAGAVSTDSTIDGDGNATDLTIAPNAITSARILDGEVQTADIAAAAITGPKMATNSVQGSFLGTSVIVPNTIGQADIGDGAIGPGEIQSDAVSSDEIDDDSIEAIDINTGAVETDEILDGTIMNIDIAAGAAIDGTKINPNFGAQNITTTGDITTTGTVDTGIIVVAGTQEHPDYVFEKYFLGRSVLKIEYDFISLEEIESFVKKYHHLPGIKSAAVVKKEGKWNLGKSNIQNLEKIEELFLHTIEQENKIKKLQTENESLKETLKSMQNSIQEIKTVLETKE